LSDANAELSSLTMSLGDKSLVGIVSFVSSLVVENLSEVFFVF